MPSCQVEETTPKPPSGPWIAKATRIPGTAAGGSMAVATPSWSVGDAHIVAAVVGKADRRAGHGLAGLEVGDPGQRLVARRSSRVTFRFVRARSWRGGLVVGDWARETAGSRCPREAAFRRRRASGSRRCRSGYARPSSAASIRGQAGSSAADICPRLLPELAAGELQEIVFRHRVQAEADFGHVAVDDHRLGVGVGVVGAHLRSGR